MVVGPTLIICGHAAHSNFPRDLVLHILLFTRTILENCYNRCLYSSVEHLGKLLKLDDTEIVLATLAVLVSLVKKTRSRVTSHRIHGDPVLNSHLFYLTKGWGGKQDGLGLLYCVQDSDVSSNVSTPLIFVKQKKAFHV